MGGPATAKVVSTKNAGIDARSAMSRRFWGESSRVMAKKTGMAPIGSTTKKMAERDSRLKLSHSLIIWSAAGCSPSALCTIVCFPARCAAHTILKVEEATYRELVEDRKSVV